MFTYSQINSQMIEAVLVVYSVYIVRSEKENHRNIFGGLCHIIYMIILYGKQNNNTW